MNGEGLGSLSLHAENGYLLVSGISNILLWIAYDVSRASLVFIGTIL